MLTTSAAAKRLGVKASRIRQFILAGRIEAVKIGRDLFISEKESERFESEDRDRRSNRWQGERGQP